MNVIRNFKPEKCGRKTRLNPEAYTVSQLKLIVSQLVGQPILPFLSKERYDTIKTSKEKMCEHLRMVMNNRNNNAAVAQRNRNNNAAVAQRNRNNRGG